MAIKNSVNDFLSTFVDSINLFDWHLPGVGVLPCKYKYGQ